jgi:DNA-binding NarL/FixJ family response regulator
VSALLEVDQGTAAALKPSSADRRERGPGEIRVVVADDDPRTRRTVSERLATADVRVVGQARTGDEAVALALGLAPDIVVMDLLMQGRDGIAATRRIAAEAPDVKVVILSINTDPEAVLVALRAGAVGFLGKGIDMDALLRTVRGVYRGEAALDRLTTRTLVGEFQAMSVRALGQTSQGAQATGTQSSFQNARATVEATLRRVRALSRKGTP